MQDTLKVIIIRYTMSIDIRQSKVGGETKKVGEKDNVEATEVIVAPEFMVEFSRNKAIEQLRFHKKNFICLNVEYFKLNEIYQNSRY